MQDPAHVPVSHHGIVGNRYTGAQPLKLELTQPVKAQSGYEMKITQSDANALGAAFSLNTFKPPSLLQITSEFEGGGKLILALYATPSRPGYTNHIGCQVLVRNRDGTLPPGLGAFALPMPKWLLHVTSSFFLNQDAVFLHHQEKILAKGALGRTPYAAQPDGGDYVQAVYTPNVSDKGIITFRRWLKKHAGGGVPWTGPAALPERAMDGQKLFDVYESHTKNCRYCLGALRNVRRAKVGAFVASALLVLLRGTLGVVPSALLATGAALVGTMLGKLQDLFYKFEFTHATNH
jgi:phenylpropionate dioxygenase-like ring-hydroxylating dioxygenase large terminal subunit